jgi:indolepyruvate ferredoxin oxidoreductase beta subunit
VEKADFLVSGVGGQGVILASGVIATVGLATGYDVKKSEIRGVAQRSGSVVGHVRWGQEVQSPIVPEGCVDYLVAAETLEGLRWLDEVRPEGTVFINDQRIPPVSMAGEDVSYPDPGMVEETLQAVAARVFFIPALEIARQLGNPRVLNVILLGALSTMLPVAPNVWEDALGERLPPRVADLNLRAFGKGRAWLEEAMRG